MNLPDNPNADLIRLNPHLFPEHAQAHHHTTNPEPQPNRGPEPLAVAQTTAGSVQRICIRVQSYRNKLQDPDNGFIKHHIDALRHWGVIADDTQDHITLEILPDVKVRTKREERTEMELNYEH